MMVLPTRRVAVYARVGAADAQRNPEAQLVPLRTFVAAQGWTIAGEFVDHASAADLRGRTAWGDLLDRASRRTLELILVWRLDRAFTDIHDAASTLGRLRGWNVGLRSYREPWLDTTSPFGEVLYYVTLAYARLERAAGAAAQRTGRVAARG